MSQDLPGSIGKLKGSDCDYEFENTVLRLHAVLTRLDGALHDALRGLDVALGRRVTEDPERLPMKEISRLRHHLEVATGRNATAVRPNLHEIALEHPDVDTERPVPARVAGVAPIKQERKVG